MRSNVAFQRSFPQGVFLSLLRHADALVGNSSCGLYEAPSFELPAVNIGDRQRGRMRAGNVIDVEPTVEAIERGIERALSMERTGIVNPYGDGEASSRIVDALSSIADLEGLVQKRFFSPEVVHALVA